MLDVTSGDIDAYDHVNNSVYMTWFDRVAWAHSAALGLPIETCLQLDRGMAVLGPWSEADGEHLVDPGGHGRMGGRGRRVVVAVE